MPNTPRPKRRDEHGSASNPRHDPRSALSSRPRMACQTAILAKWKKRPPAVPTCLRHPDPWTHAREKVVSQQSRAPLTTYLPQINHFPTAASCCAPDPSSPTHSRHSPSAPCEHVLCMRGPAASPSPLSFPRAHSSAFPSQAACCWAPPLLALFKLCPSPQARVPTSFAAARNIMGRTTMRAREGGRSCTSQLQKRLSPCHTRRSATQCCELRGGGRTIGNRQRIVVVVSLVVCREPGRARNVSPN